MIFDMLDTKDTGLVGAIGEVIAWQYLHKNRIIASRFGQGRPWFVEKLRDEGEPDFQHSWLTEQQTDFLRDLFKQSPRLWDFVGTKHYPPEQHYLVEVKTRRPRKNRHDLRGSFKGLITEDQKRAMSLHGFKPLLVVVDLLDNWRFEVTLREL
jgi:hypothetical protein